MVRSRMHDGFKQWVSSSLLIETFILQSAGDTKHGELIQLVKTARLKGFCGDSGGGCCLKSFFTVKTRWLRYCWVAFDSLIQEHQWGDLHYPAQRGLNLHLISSRDLLWITGTLVRLSSAFDRCASFSWLNAGFTVCCSKTMRRGRMNEESWRTIGFSALFSPSFSSSASQGTQLEWRIGREEAADGGWEWEGYYPTVRCEWRAPLRRHKRAEAERRPCWKRAGHRSFASGTHAPTAFYPNPRSVEKCNSHEHLLKMYSTSGQPRCTLSEIKVQKLSLWRYLFKMNTFVPIRFKYVHFKY